MHLGSNLPNLGKWRLFLLSYHNKIVFPVVITDTMLDTSAETWHVERENVLVDLEVYGAHFSRMYKNVTYLFCSRNNTIIREWASLQ